MCLQLHMRIYSTKYGVFLSVRCNYKSKLQPNKEVVGNR